MYTRLFWGTMALLLVIHNSGCSSEDSVPNHETPAPEDPCGPEAMDEVFTRRIAPLLDQNRPSSCNECHLSGITPGLFLREDPCEAMSCLIAQDLVSLEDPRNSLFLSWIQRAEEGEGAEISREIASREYDAILEWIEFSAACHTRACSDQGLVCEDATLPEVPEEGSGGCTEENHEDCVETPAEQREYFGPRFWTCEEEGIVTAFHDVVMPWTGRCEHCHVEDPLIDIGDPTPWLEHGVELEDSARTLQNLLDLGTIETEVFEESALLLKPLSEEAGGLEHGGGTKFEDQEDPSYVDFAAWLRFYQRCVMRNAEEME